MEIGDRTQVTLGTRQVEVTVTRQNLEMLQDGDLTNDLQRIGAMGGDGASITAADFNAAGFDPADQNLLTRMSQGIATVTISAASLGTQQANFQAIVASKPYLRTNGQTPTLQQLQTTIQAMPVAGRNGVLAELATETAMLQVREQTLAAMAPDLRTRLAAIAGAGDPTAAIRAALEAMPGGGSRANTVALQRAVLTFPDMPLASKHGALEALGMTNLAERNTAISAARNTALAQVRTIAQDLYQQMGGLGTMGETHSMATGDGTTTMGLAGEANRGIAYMSYANAASSDGISVSGTHRNAMTFTPADVTQPAAIHLSATGANYEGNRVAITRGDQTIHFRASMDGDNTKLELVPNQRGVSDDPNVPAEVHYDRSSQTLIFPAGAQPIQVTQSSASGKNRDYDEVQFSITGFNVSTGQPSVAIDFGELFASNRFNIDWNQLPADQQQQIERYAQYLADNPDRRLTLDVQGKGPKDFDGTAMAEINGYGAAGSGRSLTEMAGLRSSKLDVDAKAGTGTVTATTDPVASTLSGSLTPAGRTALQTFRQANTGLTDNDVLAGLRAHAIVQLLRDRVAAHGGNPAQVQVGTSVVDRATPFTTADYQAITAGQQVLQNVPQR